MSTAKDLRQQAIELENQTRGLITNAGALAKGTTAPGYLNDFEQLLDTGAMLTAIAQHIELMTTTWAELAGQQNASWRQIGTPLGITRQRAQQRYGNGE